MINNNLFIYTLWIDRKINWLETIDDFLLSSGITMGKCIRKNGLILFASGSILLVPLNQIKLKPDSKWSILRFLVYLITYG